MLPWSGSFGASVSPLWKHLPSDKPISLSPGWGRHSTDHLTLQVLRDEPNEKKLNVSLDKEIEGILSQRARGLGQSPPCHLRDTYRRHQQWELTSPTRGCATASIHRPAPSVPLLLPTTQQDLQDLLVCVQSCAVVSRVMGS